MDRSDTDPCVGSCYLDIIHGERKTSSFLPRHAHLSQFRSHKKYSGNGALLFICWTSIADGDPALRQHRVCQGGYNHITSLGLPCICWISTRPGMHYLRNKMSEIKCLLIRLALKQVISQ